MTSTSHATERIKHGIALSEQLLQATWSPHCQLTSNFLHLLVLLKRVLRQELKTRTRRLSMFLLVAGVAPCSIEREWKMFTGLSLPEYIAIQQSTTSCLRIWVMLPSIYFRIHYPLRKSLPLFWEKSVSFIPFYFFSSSCLLTYSAFF